LFIKTDEQINMRIFGQLSNFALISVDLKLLKCPGATRARNLGVKCSRGAVVVFIDSDLVVTSDFLHAHGAALLEAQKQDGGDRAFTYGRVINTSNFERPEAENFKLTDKSAAFFATGNVAISRRLLLKAGELLGNAAEGPFDADFSEYGWEDLELGVGCLRSEAQRTRSKD
jgi:glycosyltransferase involved in cell wall biosynthesis